MIFIPAMKSIKGIVFLLTLALFIVLAPKSYADDPCAPITAAPDLYQINRTPTQDKLFFTPIANDQVQTYTIIYGLKAEDERYSQTINQGPSSGAITYTINELTPGVQYYYKVRGSTSCTDSPWSTWVGDKAVATGSAQTVNVPVTGPSTIYIWGACSLLLMISGLGLFTFAKRKA